MQIPSLGARALTIAALAAIVAIPAQSPAPVAAADPADSVIASARHHLGAPWSYGAMGPYAFDCSGLVLHAFREAGLYAKVGSGNYRSARALYDYFRSRGLASTGGGRRGDLVVYGGGSHVGIYLGDGQVISTLTSGVRIHGLYAVTSGFSAFLHTGLSGTTIAPTTTSGVRYTTGWVNFRKGPGTQYAIIQQLAPDRRLSILGSARDGSGRLWYKALISNGRIGWVASWYTRAG